MASSTTKAQRIGIWVIAIALLIGTIGTFAAIILSTQNQQTDQARFEQLQAEYTAEYTAYQEKVDAQAAELSTQYYDTFSQYQSRVAKFDAESVGTEVATEDILVGDGETITDATDYSVYYIGWLPTGVIFDGSIDGDSLKAPLAIGPNGLSVIAGWTQGSLGMQVGGVREITIPSDLAYGEAGSGDTIPPNTPIKFLVMVIPNPETIEEPQPSEEFIKLYEQQYYN